MKQFFLLLCGAAVLPLYLSAAEAGDSTAVNSIHDKLLDEIVVTAKRPALKQDADRIVYIIGNDKYAAGLNGMQLLDRMPRISVINDNVAVAGKNGVRYIVDGRLLEMTDDAIALKLKNLQADGIKKIELLTTPPARYGAGNNVAYISITTRNESLGTRGNMWGNAGMTEDFRYSAGGNISHTTRRVDLSADLAWSDTKGRNDIYNEYRFADYDRLSDRVNRFRWRSLGANGMFRYKFSSDLSAGVIVNFSASPIRSDVRETTVEGNTVMTSESFSPAKPDNALTLTAFADWNFDAAGKMLSLTYNCFDKHNVGYTDVTTAWNSGYDAFMTKDACNNYRIHSLKLDATLPFSSFRMETGAAYTVIDNNTDIRVSNLDDGAWVDDLTQSNHFMYDEKTVAAYLSASRSFGSLSGKVGLRYEHTDLNGVQRVNDMRHDMSYGYLMPTVNLSWNTARAGRFSADYSMGINRPAFGDLNPFRYYSTVKDYFTGNPDLEPVRVHNVGINYSFRGIYAVLYGTWSRNAVGYITRFEPDGTKWSTPENCMNTVKAGLYASYNRSIFNWWNLKVGGEVFYSGAKSAVDYYRDSDDNGWSGKLEANSSWMLNRQKSLILNLRCTHFFPYHDGMSRYSARTLIGCELRYMLLDNRLSLAASVSDPFGWNITRSKAYFKDFSVISRTDIHSHIASVRISYSFGSPKVKGVYRDTKERESQRSY